MKIRTKLVLACFLLSVLPLSGIVLYSYRSSRSALESAYHSEAARMTRQMDHRLTAIRSELEQRLAEVSVLPLQTLPNGAPATDRRVADNVLFTLGDTARLVDSLELQPVGMHPDFAPNAPHVAAQNPVQPSPAPHPNVQPAPRAEPRVAAAPEPAEESSTETAASASTDKGASSSSSTEAAAASAAEAESPEAIVIGIPAAPRVPRFVMSKEQHDRIRDIARLGVEMGRAATQEQRDATLKQLDALQKQFNDEMQSSQKEFNEQLQSKLQLAEQRRHVIDQERSAREQRTRAKDRAPVLPPPPPASPAEDEVTITRKLTNEQRAGLRAHERRATLLFGQRMNFPVRKEGAVVANLSAQVKGEEVIRRVLGNPSDDGELAFAADRDGNIYTRTAADRKTLDRLGISRAVAAGKPIPRLEDWVVVLKTDPMSGLRVGVARPVGEDLGELRRTAAFNFSAGMALVFIALIGIVPLANHMTSDVKLVTAGAERIAAGDLMTRLPVTSGNELGQLAVAFNKMAEDLSHQQQTIVEQERSRKEQEMQQRILEIEYGRKSIELEDARRFQLSMLPKVVPQHDAFEIAVSTETATEVGGDYYDFHVAPDGTLSVTVGDATGHGAKAGTMVTVVKTLFASYTAEASPSAFLRDSAEKIKRMDFGRMAMSLLLARFEPRRLTIAAAGMPPALVHRAASGTVDEIALAAPPLGTLDSDYDERVIDLAPGDTVLLLTDGFPELLNAAGQQLGYPAALDAFASAAGASTADGVIASIANAAREWRGDLAPNDDLTFVVVRARQG
jgi:serine phosphatase RsbU (regulator of sigma subunit)